MEVQAMENSGLEKGLEQDARRIAERLPEKLTIPEIEKLIDSVRRFKESNGFTYVQIARWVGYSKSVVSEFIGCVEFPTISGTPRRRSPLHWLTTLLASVS